MKIKKIFRISLTILISFILIFAVTGCDKKDEQKLLKEKAPSEIKYLEVKIIG